MLIRPGVKIKPIEGDTCHAHWNLDEIRPYIAFENRRAHSEIGCCLRWAKQPGEKDHKHFSYALRRLKCAQMREESGGNPRHSDEAQRQCLFLESALDLGRMRAIVSRNSIGISRRSGLELLAEVFLIRASSADW